MRNPRQLQVWGDIGRDIGGSPVVADAGPSGAGREEIIALNLLHFFMLPVF